MAGIGVCWAAGTAHRSPSQTVESPATYVRPEVAVMMMLLCIPVAFDAAAEKPVALSQGAGGASIRRHCS